MSDVLERLKDLEMDLSLNLWKHQGNSDAQADAIHRHTMLVAREAWADGFRTARCYTVGGPSAPCEIAEDARECFPLTRKVLRDEPDPNCPDVLWRWSGHFFEVKEGSDEWRSLPAMTKFLPSEARVELWHSLKQQPYREEPE